MRTRQPELTQRTPRRSRALPLLAIRAVAGPATIPLATDLATYLAVSLFNLFVLILHFQGDLTLYIHPRYIVFTVIVNAASMIACTAGFTATAWRATSQPLDEALDGEASDHEASDHEASDHEASDDGILDEPSDESKGTVQVGERRSLQRPSFTFSFTFCVAALVLAAAYILPASTLSSSMAHQRASNTNTGVGLPAQGPDGVTGSTADGTVESGAGETGAGETDALSWTKLLGAEASPGYYEGAEVDVVGFVYRPEGSPPDVFYVARFVVTCCAVDAQPVGLPVRHPGWQERFEEDAWVRVQGAFATTPAGANGAYILEPQQVRLAP